MPFDLGSSSGRVSPARQADCKGSVPLAHSNQESQLRMSMSRSEGAQLSEHLPRLVAVTLIAGVLTDQYVAQISDLRVTRLVGQKVVSQEDTDVKTIALGGQFLMGLTGLARIGGLRVEAWVSWVLKGVPQEEYFEVLREEIENAFVREGQAGKLPHAFLAVGYMTDRPGGKVRPVSITISNSFDATGTFSPAALVSEQFRINVEQLGNRRQFIVSVGYPMHSTARKALEHRVRIVAKGDPGNPALTIWPLLTALRDTARRSGGFVGTTALFASMPRSALPDPSVSSGQGVDYRTKVASVYLSDEAHHPADGAVRMPATISQGVHLYGLKVHPRALSPEEIRARASDVSYRPPLAKT
jgi:hypothetical protein